MANSLESSSYRTRWASQTHTAVPTDNIANWESQIVNEHLGGGWIQEASDADKFIFSAMTSDGKKWTREYDRKTCRFICQRFYSIEHVAKAAVQWPDGEFGD